MLSHWIQLQNGSMVRGSYIRALRLLTEDDYDSPLSVYLFRLLDSGEEIVVSTYGDQNLRATGESPQVYADAESARIAYVHVPDY